MARDLGVSYEPVRSVCKRVRLEAAPRGRNCESWLFRIPAEGTDGTTRCSSFSRHGLGVGTPVVVQLQHFLGLRRGLLQGQRTAGASYDLGGVAERFRGRSMWPLVVITRRQGDAAASAVAAPPPWRRVAVGCHAGAPREGRHVDHLHGEAAPVAGASSSTVDCVLGGPGGRLDSWLNFE